MLLIAGAGLLIVSLSVTIYYFTMKIKLSQKTYPISKRFLTSAKIYISHGDISFPSYLIAGVWSFMTSKWSFLLSLYSYKLNHFLLFSVRLDLYGALAALHSALVRYRFHNVRVFSHVHAL